jgi:hypothetical protein
METIEDLERRHCLYLIMPLKFLPSEIRFCYVWEHFVTQILNPYSWEIIYTYNTEDRPAVFLFPFWCQK